MSHTGPSINRSTLPVREHKASKGLRPHFSLNTQPHTHTATIDIHIQGHQGHTHQPEMWRRLPVFEPHSIVSHSSQRTNRSVHRDVITCRLMSSYSQNKWSITSPITGRPTGKWQPTQRRLVPPCHCRRLSRKARWGAPLNRRAFLSSLAPSVGGGEIEGSWAFGRLLKLWIPRTKERQEGGEGKGEMLPPLLQCWKWNPASSMPGQWSTIESHPTKD